ncbi:sugar transferase [Propioniciclava soli]|uniref:sugar transferase n=1 Tax=Propioniciclava soli TaxID=2775081 RepID=UPI001E5B7328|nr:sugar transferase [Propioniciclava soli]
MGKGDVHSVGMSAHAAGQRDVEQTQRPSSQPWPAISLASDIAALALPGAVVLASPVGQEWVIANGVVTIVGAATVLMVLWIAALHLLGAHGTKIRTTTTALSHASAAGLISLGLTSIGFLMLDQRLPRNSTLTLFAIMMATMLAQSWLLNRLVSSARRRGIFTTPVLLAGNNNRVDEIARVLQRERWLGYTVVGAVVPEPDIAFTPSGLPVLGAVAETPSLVADYRASAVMFTEGSFADSGSFRRMTWALQDHNVDAILVSGLTDISTSRISVQLSAGLHLVHIRRPQAARASYKLKRLLDVIAAVFFLILFSPTMAAVALAIKLEDGGPAIFRQQRIGLRGAQFGCLKFRSMVVDPESRMTAIMNQKGTANRILFKMADDPRITKVGRFIRRYSLDELPQFWNVLEGDMSIVGPRPALPGEVVMYDSDARGRLRVRPGVTGLWQVSGRSNLSWDETVRLDLYYVDNWSMWLDLSILARTAKAVLSSSGAY